MPTKQSEANRKWIEKNKERNAYINKRSTARGFIKNLATQEDLDELKGLIAQREISMNEKGTD